MKKPLLTGALMFCGLLSASAVAWLPTPVITGETINDGSVTIDWTYDDSEEPCDYFQVIVYKMHKAAAAETFVLAETNFDYIESTGTMVKSENRGAIWDFIPGCPGWWVKYPMYMNGAMGIDTFFYYTGSDNADIFGGAYMVSPDYDLSKLTNPAVKVEASLAHEAVSVTGGFVLWAWNTNWFDPKNIDYKPVYDDDIHYDDLSDKSWKSVSETLTFPDPADYTDTDHLEEIAGINKTRSRVMFYGKGYSSYWINDFKVSVDMAAGDMVDYGAEIHDVEGKTFTIDTSSDTESDYIYAYEVRPVKLENDESRGVVTVRFVNYAYSTPRHVIGQFSGIEDVAVSQGDVKIEAHDGMIVISGAGNDGAQVYTVAGQCVYNGPADQPISLGAGVYIVKAGETTAKVAL